MNVVPRFTFYEGVAEPPLANIDYEDVMTDRAINASRHLDAQDAGFFHRGAANAAT